MKRNKLKISKAGTSITSAIVTGIMIASLVSILLTVLVTNNILNGQLGEKIATATIFVIRSVSVLIGALVGGTLMKKNYLKLIGFTAIGYLIVLTGMGIVFFSGSLKNFFWGAVSVLVGGAGALLILQMPKGNRVKHKKFAI